MKTELNGYLFLEFGFDGDESQVREDWPFVLSEVGSADGDHVFSFECDEEEYYAISGASLSFQRKDGADFALLQIQRRGGVGLVSAAQSTSRHREVSIQ
jgi:hypothetical protein